MTTDQINILIEDGTEISRTLVEAKGWSYSYAVGSNKISKNQFEAALERYGKKFNDVRQNGGDLKHTFRIEKSI